jgi:hypothetical protein
MQGRRVTWIALVVLLAFSAVPAMALDMKDTRGRPTPNLADEWGGRWADTTAHKIAEYRQKQTEQPSMYGFIAAVVFIIGILVWLAAKFRIWEIRSTLVNLNTLGNGWQLKWAARWGAF